MSEKDTRERLIDAAIRLFSEKGFNGASVKEIADTAGVNVSLVSYHFGGKEGLYRTCLELFGRERLAAAQRVLQPPSSVEELRVRLALFADEMWETHVQQPEICAMLHREKDMGLELAQDIFRETFLKSFETLVDFLRAAQSRGLMREELDPQMITSYFFGAVVTTAQNDRIAQQFYGRTIKDKTMRQTMLQQLIGCFLHGFAKAPASQEPRS